MTRKIFQILVPLSMSFFWIRYLDKILNSFHAKFWWTYQSYIEVRSGKLFFYSKSYKTKNWKESVPEARNQSCKHINASTFFGVNRLLKSDIILLPILKADSDVTVDAGTAKTSRAIWERVGYSTELLFHQASMSKVSLQGIGGFVK